MGEIKVLILIEDLFEDSELIYPYYRMKEEGYEVKIAAPVAGKEYKGKKGMVLRSDISASEVNAEDIFAVIVPGGYAPDKMRRDPTMVGLVKRMFMDCKVVAAICHGGWMLAEADVIKDRKVTGAASISTDLKNAGGQFIDREVVVDDNIITSRGPKDLPAFCRAIIILIKEYSRKQ
ncbi:MAG: type 1 glutamine amidotransferase domain-containing protein [Actinomycetota bacterium]